MEEITGDEVRYSPQNSIPASIMGEGRKNSLKRATESFNPRVMVGRPKTTDPYSP